MKLIVLMLFSFFFSFRCRNVKKLKCLIESVLPNPNIYLEKYPSIDINNAVSRWDKGTCFGSNKIRWVSSLQIQIQLIL